MVKEHSVSEKWHMIKEERKKGGREGGREGGSEGWGEAGREGRRV